MGRNDNEARHDGRAQTLFVLRVLLRRLAVVLHGMSAGAAVDLGLDVGTVPSNRGPTVSLGKQREWRDGRRT